MSLRNTSDSFGSIAKFLHWLIALLIIALLIVGFIMINLDDSNDFKYVIYNYHKLIGITVLSLVFLRLLWRSINPVPGLPLSTPRWEIVLERLVKFLLYFTMFLMPLSGWIFSTSAGHAPHIGNLELPAPFVPENKDISHFFDEVHLWTAWTLIGLLCLHLAGGLKHHFINKDNVLRRMMPGGK